MQNIISIDSLAQLDAAAKQLSEDVKQSVWIYLNGDLGTGKTTFSQRFIHYQGYDGIVASPTYAIMQDYKTQQGMVIHTDLYRLSEPEELFEIGLVELHEQHKAVTLVEWPNKGKGVIPTADINLTFELNNNQRTLSIEYKIV